VQEQLHQQLYTGNGYSIGVTGIRAGHLAYQVHLKFACDKNRFIDLFLKELLDTTFIFWPAFSLP
jgi:hypothetical protein